MQNSMDRCIPEKYIPLVIVLPAVTFVVGVIGAIIFSITVGVVYRHPRLKQGLNEEQAKAFIKMHEQTQPGIIYSPAL
ncbi:hypothetical protein N7536_004399 [Penicillium majusculum]|uniref:Uncharacterized protein n=1 Tax=Penicillium solitum TaxID=60172 RepID=A0A1V6R7J0_9EURO|nr:uncharacterized protein PENSOL_c012G05392 [Penicillium solitum]KAJ5693987.1 hypothetical protein N7536_004399 [Penicillium majusculum]OQD97478.1 hypothetical protein PENSOL_c012G05392 [Penicillium solitum]